ncbi:putative zinc-binding protein [Pseudoduganella sp. HUAS MS19]
MADKKLPLAYSFSGYSSAAQLANAVAICLDRDGTAEMAGIVGVGGVVAPLIKLARSGHTIIAIDGCPLACTREYLAKQGVTPDQKMHTDCDPADLDILAVHATELLKHRQRSREEQGSLFR